MSAKSAVTTEVVNAPERTFTGLRRFNAIMGFLHLVQGILMIVLSNDTTYPIYTNYLRFDLDTFSLTPDPQLVYNLPFGPAVAVFLLISAVAHFYLATIGYQGYVSKLKKGILGLSASVENAVHLSVKSVSERDARMARAVIDGDEEIDQMEVDLEEDCLKLLALYQPVAIDLRYIVAVLKINNDLERIGDQAVNIAERVITLAKQDFDNFVFDYTTMVEKAQIMLKMSLDALVQMDVDLALKVCTLDDEVDEKKEQAYDSIKRAVKTDPDHIGYYINLLLISRHLERLADHSTNIAEEVVYLVEAKPIWHVPHTESEGNDQAKPRPRRG